uniref:NEL-type E3 ubiquitin ligase domain-containing protein n=1 Tax=Endozoicomonas sp. SESOKO1 TaxID=2828742 RepID=UPI00214756F0
MNTNAMTTGTMPLANTSSPVDNSQVDQNRLDQNNVNGQRCIPQPETASYPSATASLADRDATESIPVTPDEMKELILRGNFSNDVHYLVIGNLKLDQCPAASLPGQFSVFGDLSLTDCVNLKHISGKLTVQGDFSVSGDTGLETLSGKIHIKGDGMLKNRLNLKSLSGDITVDGQLYLEMCPELSELPEQLIVKSHFRLKACNKISKLPDNLGVGGALLLRRCTGIRELPRNLSAAELILDDCSGLSELPDGLYVRGDVSLIGCISLRALPENPFFEGHLSLKGCRSLTALPNWITELGALVGGQTREVDLSDTGLSDELHQRISALPQPEGMLFRFDMGRGNPAHKFETLQEGLDFWRELASADAETPELNLQSGQAAHLIGFFGRLTGTADYQNLATRPVLAQRVMAVMSLMAGNDQLRNAAVDRIVFGSTSCDDRVTLALDDLETMQLLTAAQTLAVEQHDPTQLKALGRQMMILDKIKAIARSHMQTLAWVDEIEVELAFRIELGKFFEFPGSTQEMLFRKCAFVNDKDIESARANIEETCTDAALEAFLAQWEPWQKFQRPLAVRPFDQLEPRPVDRIDDCPIFGEKTDKMIRLGNVHVDYDSLVKSYLLNGEN